MLKSNIFIDSSLLNVLKQTETVLSFIYKVILNIIHYKLESIVVLINVTFDLTIYNNERWNKYLPHQYHTEKGSSI